MTNVPELVGELMPYLEALVAETVRNATSRVATPAWIPASVVSVERSSSTAIVLPDGSSDSDQVTAQTLTGLPAVGSRVMLLMAPPSGVFIVGQADGTPPWSTAWGIVASAENASGTTPITTITDLGASISWTMIAGRQYEIETSISAGSTSASDALSGWIADESNNLLRRIWRDTAPATERLQATTFLTSGSGQVTRKLRFEQNSGSGVVTVSGNGFGVTGGPTITARDIGPIVT